MCHITILVKKVIPVRKIRDVVFTDLMNGKLFIIKQFTRRELLMATLSDDARRLQPFPVLESPSNSAFMGSTEGESCFL